MPVTGAAATVKPALTDCATPVASADTEQLPEPVVWITADALPPASTAAVAGDTVPQVLEKATVTEFDAAGAPLMLALTLTPTDWPSCTACGATASPDSATLPATSCRSSDWLTSVPSSVALAVAVT